jgi:hypothetical protein
MQTILPGRVVPFYNEGRTGSPRKNRIRQPC